MREIKFRAWDKTHKRMYFVGDEYGTAKGYDALTYQDEGQDVEVMQFTGLRDKNGVEIYEGDILRVTRSNHVWDSDLVEHLPVTYDKCRFMVKSKYQDLVVSNDYFGIKMEVVGNIYENPELSDD